MIESGLALERAVELAALRSAGFRRACRRTPVKWLMTALAKVVKVTVALRGSVRR